MTETVVPALGIDLGTTNSAAAVILGDEVMLVPDQTGAHIHASALAFDDNHQVYVGNSALALCRDQKRFVFLQTAHRHTPGTV